MGEQDVRPTEVILDLADDRSVRQHTLDLLRPELAPEVLIPEVLLEFLELRFEAPVLRPFNHVLGALPPGAHELVGGEDPHLREGRQVRRLRDRGPLFCIKLFEHLVFKSGQRLIDQREVERLHA